LRKQIKLIVCQPRKKEIGFEKICEMQIRKIGRIGKITVFTDAEFKAQHVFERKKKLIHKKVVCLITKQRLEIESTGVELHHLLGARKFP
jgi:hypothetical protein